MSLLQNIVGGLRGLFQKQQVEQEMDEELRGYVDAAATEKINAGMNRVQALRAARLDFGSRESVKESVRRAGWESFVQSLWQDLRFGLRTLRKSPGFTTAAVLTLALGIGTNTAIFSVVNTVLLKPFAYPDPERIVMFQNTFHQFASTGSAAPTEFNWWRQHAEGFQYVSAYGFTVANLTGKPFPEQIPAMRVSADFFRLCGADAVHGRTFTPEDDVLKAPKTVVLAFSFWQRHFGGDPQVIGRLITLNGESSEIIGVLGSTLNDSQIAEQSLVSGDIEINEPPDVYIPFQLDPNSPERGHYFNVAGRLKPGVSLAAANAQLQASYQEYARKWPDVTPGAGFGARPLQDAVVGGVRNSLLILLGAVGFVLLIACANVANLVRARAIGRQREIAIRAAVGAGRGRIIRQLLTENLVLSLAGGVLGLAAGYTGIRTILSLIPGDIPLIGASGSNVSLDWRVWGFTAGLSILTGIVFGLVPARQSSRVDLSSTLRESSNRSSKGSRHNQTRALLVITEMALAAVLLIGAVLLIRSFLAIQQVNPGFDAHNVLTMRISLTGPQFATAGSVSQVIHEGVRRIRALPGVEAAGTTCCVPLEDRLHGSFRIAGRPEGPASGGRMGWALISPGYFESLKIPVLRGRSFMERDETGPPVVIISQTLAKQFWSDGDPLNDWMMIGDEPPRQIIGVVGDVHDDALNRKPRPNLYLLAAQINDTRVFQDMPWAWVIRTRVAPMSLSSAIQNELREASGGLPVARVRTMEETLSRSMAPDNFNTVVLTLFGCSALLLAAIGIYGLIAYSVRQRTHEIGVRLALGAQRSTVLRAVIGNGMKLAMIGVAIGITASLALTGLLSSLLFGVGPTDPGTFAVVALLLLGVGLLACYIPARRATKVDPMAALRYE